MTVTDLAPVDEATGLGKVAHCYCLVCRKGVALCGHVTNKPIDGPTSTGERCVVCDDLAWTEPCPTCGDMP